MENIVLVIHLLIAIALVSVVLMQRSEGGALGIGGGGGGGGAGGFLTGRGTANLLTRTTAVLAVAFFITSITLSLLARSGGDQGSIFEGRPAAPSQSAPATPGGTQQPAPGTGTGGLAPLPTLPSGN